ncbi:hypothetical protein K0651_13290 [Ornithinimicrobium sp. Arc0846-15]|nr:hypothetical protein [Ornithinimicrobium laminariae]
MKHASSRAKRTCVVGAVLLLGLAGCTGDSSESGEAVATATPDEVRATSVAPTAEDPTTEEPSPATPTYANENEEAAAQAVIDLWTVIDEVRQDPEASPGEMAEVSSGQAFDQWTLTLQQDQQDGFVFAGNTIVEIESVTELGEPGTYKVVACMDISDLSINGEYLDRSASGGDFQRATFATSFDETRGKVVVIESPLEYEPCAP